MEYNHFAVFGMWMESSRQGKEGGEGVGRSVGVACRVESEVKEKGWEFTCTLMKIRVATGKQT